MLNQVTESERQKGVNIRALARSWADRRGVTAVEYAIIVGIMVAALVISVPLIGKNLTNIFTSVTTPL
jgi:Flp pilus assembly pilin Flp